MKYLQCAIERKNIKKLFCASTSRIDQIKWGDFSVAPESVLAFD